MSSPISNYEEIYLDLKNQLGNIDTQKKDTLKVLKQSLFKFHKKIEYIPSKKLLIGYVSVIILSLLFLKPKMIYKKYKNIEGDIVTKFSIQKFSYTLFILCIPIFIYVIMRSKF